MAHIGRFKSPMLRNLGPHVRHFHNGFAKELDTVVDVYEDRFAIGLPSKRASTSSPSPHALVAAPSAMNESSERWFSYHGRARQLASTMSTAEVAAPRMMRAAIGPRR